MSQASTQKMTGAQSVRIVRYEESHREVWNRFIGQAKNATFLFHRDYLEYHSGRFRDHSALVYEGETLKAVLPANEEGDLLSSHSGLTYGGLILENDARLEKTLQWFGELLDYYRGCGFSSLVYKKLPFYYSRLPSFEDGYALTAFGGKVTELRMGFILDTSLPPRFSQRRLRGIRNAERSACVVSRSTAFAEYWETVLTPNLTRRDSRPVHTIEEIERLVKLFPENIALYECRAAGKMIAGCVIYFCGKVAHAQYIASTTESRSIGGGDLLFRSLFHELYPRFETISLGTSHDPATGKLDLGLVEWKESLGARAVAHEIYELPLVGSFRERAATLLLRPAL